MNTGTHADVTDPQPVTVTPGSIVIDNLAPGVSGVAQVAVTNVSGRKAQVSVTGHLAADHPLAPADLLMVELDACPQPWAGVPDVPTAPHAAPVCQSGEIPSSSGSLAAVPLEEGQTTYLLISAELGDDAGAAAMGQRWTATFDVTTTSNAEPAGPALATTGGDVLLALAWAVGLVAAGLAFRRARRIRHTNGEAR